jgi:hypothetical protein
MTMKSLRDWSGVALLLIFVIFSIAVLIYVSDLGADGASLFINTLIAIGTATAAIMAGKSARAARDSADRWKEQKHYERELDAALEALFRFNEWRNTVNQLRVGFGGRLSSYILEDFLEGSEKTLFHKQIIGELHKLIETSTRMRSEIDKARILGIYEHESVQDVLKLDSEITKAMQVLEHKILTDGLLDIDLDEIVRTISSCEKPDDFGGRLHGAWMNFELRYKAIIKARGGNSFQ